MCPWALLVFASAEYFFLEAREFWYSKQSSVGWPLSLFQNKPTIILCFCYFLFFPRPAGARHLDLDPRTRVIGDQLVRVFQDRAPWVLLRTAGSWLVMVNVLLLLACHRDTLNLGYHWWQWGSGHNWGFEHTQKHRCQGAMFRWLSAWVRAYQAKGSINATS